MDASSYGLGGVILQKHNGVLQPLAYCSRTLSDSEKNYAQLEKECLASVFVCEKFDRYLCGLDNFTLLTDHKPLVPLINMKSLDNTPLGCQRPLMRLMRYHFSAVYTPGKNLVIADTLSRSPLHEYGDMDLQDELQPCVDTVLGTRVSLSKLSSIRLGT